jgi:hypothetical protein
MCFISMVAAIARWSSSIQATTGRIIVPLAAPAKTTQTQNIEAPNV